VLPLRDIVVFPHMIVPLFVGREKSRSGAGRGWRSDTFILLATQKNAPTPIRRPTRFSPSARWRACCSCSSCRRNRQVLVEGATRAERAQVHDRSDYYEADAT